MTGMTYPSFYLLLMELKFQLFQNSRNFSVRVYGLQVHNAIVNISYHLLSFFSISSRNFTVNNHGNCRSPSDSFTAVNSPYNLVFCLVITPIHYYVINTIRKISTQSRLQLDSPTNQYRSTSRIHAYVQVTTRQLIHVD